MHVFFMRKGMRLEPPADAGAEETPRQQRGLPIHDSGVSTDAHMKHQGCKSTDCDKGKQTDARTPIVGETIRQSDCENGDGDAFLGEQNADAQNDCGNDRRVPDGDRTVIAPLA